MSKRLIKTPKEKGLKEKREEEWKGRREESERKERKNGKEGDENVSKSPSSKTTTNN